MARERGPVAAPPRLGHRRDAVDADRRALGEPERRGHQPALGQADEHRHARDPQGRGREQLPDEVDRQPECLGDDDQVVIEARLVVHVPDLEAAIAGRPAPRSSIGWATIPGRASSGSSRRPRRSSFRRQHVVAAGSHADLERKAAPAQHRDRPSELRRIDHLADGEHLVERRERQVAREPCDRPLAPGGAARRDRDAAHPDAELVGELEAREVRVRQALRRRHRGQSARSAAAACGAPRRRTLDWRGPVRRRSTEHGQRESSMVSSRFARPRSSP